MTHSVPVPTHLLFDFFGTLVAYSESRVEQGYPRSHALLQECGADLAYEQFLARFDETFRELEIVAQRSLDEFSMDTMCAEFFRRALAAVPDAATLVAFRDTYLEEWSKGVSYLDGVPELLDELARRFVLVLVTNTHHADLVHGHLRAMGVERCFAKIVTSVEHGRRKPSPCIFERALVETGGRPGAAWYVGDSFDYDHRGATAAGLRCLLIDPDARHPVHDADRLRHVLELADRLSVARGRRG